jgi:hypothetical protein
MDASSMRGLRHKPKTADSSETLTFEWGRVIAGLVEVFVRSLEPIRPGRRFSRNVSRVKVQTHCFAYAPCR